ncbi:hypothetical protein VPH35_134605 [Triticum aestivum]|uniref:Uncharacterized protein n=1 Tax=Aegilops tauschii TaxID=37682 RepID=M8CHP9_AEGTA
MEEQGLPRGDLHDDLPLPDDVLADLLRRLAPQSLAAARCVRKAWRRTIDERHLLRADKLPLSLAGIFIQFDYHVFPEFFARPSSSAHAAVNTKLDFLPRPSYPFGEVGDLVFQDYFVQDHCNGLLLTYGSVGEKVFCETSNAAGVVADARSWWDWDKGGVAYWQQALYVQYQTNVVMRISLSDDTYRMIKLPAYKKYMDYNLGRSKNGVYCASYINGVFQVWILDESYGQMKWLLKGEYDLKCVRADECVHGPWVLEDINYVFFRSQLPDVKKKAIDKEKADWNSDNDDVDEDIDVVQGHRRHGCHVLGFHPFKEILFLSSFTDKEWDATVHAYHLNSWRVECLGTFNNYCSVITIIFQKFRCYSLAQEEIFGG